METKQRVVLSLTTGQAKMLSAAMLLIAVQYEEDCQEKELAQKISKRIDRTILKQAFIERCIADGIGKPTKEAKKKFMEGLK